MLNEVIDIVKQASALMKTDGFEIMQKDGIANLVTSSDLAVQHFLIEKLTALLPDCGFLCEEEDLRDTTEEYVWVVDPIDGTANYSRGISDCCISVALARNGELQLGVVYSPGRAVLFSAERGKGAFCNGRSIHVSKRDFADAMFCTAMCTYYKENSKVCSDIIYDVFQRCNDIRRFGSAAIEICMLAAGYIELYYEFRLSPWDYAAGTLILQEAGGVICSINGNLPSLTRPSTVIAANSQANLDELLTRVRKYQK